MSSTLSVYRVVTIVLLTTICGCSSSHQARVPLASSSKPHESHAAADLPPKQVAEICMATAKELELAGHVQDAIKLYERARQQNPKLTQIAHHLAVLHQRNGEFDRAIAEYQIAIATAPKDKALLNDLGYCYYELQNFVAAETAIRKALAIDSKYDRAWGNLGLVLGSMERYEESYDAFVHVVSPAEARSNVGVLLAQHGKTSEAKRSFEQALAIAPNLKQAEVMLATLRNAGATRAEPDRNQDVSVSQFTDQRNDEQTLVAP